MQGPIPQRVSIVDITYDVIVQRIQSGEWGLTLPGERAIAETLEVGRDTVRTVLNRLNLEGIISDGKQGRLRMILKKPTTQQPQSSDKREHVGLISSVSMERMAPSVLLEILHFRESLEAKNKSLKIYSGPWLLRTSFRQRLMDIVEKSNCDFWLLYRAPKPVQQWFEQNKIKCLLRGQPHAGINLAYLDTDWELTARHAATKLWRLGHKKVAVIAQDEQLKGMQAALAGVQSIGDPEWHCEIIHNCNDLDSTVRNTHMALHANPDITAIICTRAHHVPSLYTYLGSALNLKIPRDMSLTVINHEPMLDYLYPPVSHYSIDIDNLNRKLLRAMSRIHAGKPYSISNAYVIPSEFEGQSIAAPRSGPLAIGRFPAKD